VSVPSSVELVGAVAPVGAVEGRRRAACAASVPSAGTRIGPVSLPDTAQGRVWSQTLISPRSMRTSRGVQESSVCSLIKKRKLSHAIEPMLHHRDRQQQPQPRSKLHRLAPMHRVSLGPSQHQELQWPDGPQTQGDPAGCCGQSTRPGRGAGPGCTVTKSRRNPEYVRWSPAMERWGGARWKSLALLGRVEKHSKLLPRSGSHGWVTLEGRSRLYGPDARNASAPGDAWGLVAD